MRSSTASTSTSTATAMRALGPRPSPAALGLVLLAHAGAFLALQSMGTLTPPTPASALMVSLIQAEAPTARVPAVPPAKPAVAAQPVPVSRARPAPPVLATETAQAAPAAEVARADKAATAVAAVAPAAIPAPASTAAPSVAPSAPSAPRFDADYLLNPAPAYPPLSRRGGEQGTVTLHVLVEASGQASKVEVRSSSGFERLDKAAVAAVSRWKFVPARQGAEAVPAWVVVPLVFSLKP